MAPEEEKTEEATESPKKSKLLFIIIAVVVLVIGAVGAFLLLGGEEPEPEPTGPLEPVIEQVKLEPFVVNLSDNMNYLRTVVVLEYDRNIIDPPTGGLPPIPAGALLGEELVGALYTRSAQIRDGIITVLSSKKAAEVLSVEGKEVLRDELLDVVNEATGLDDYGVTAVYFLEFVVQ